MATVVIHEFVDDIDGTKTDVGTVRFAFEGVEYEIDLSGKNYSKMAQLMQVYVAAARKVGGRTQVRRGLNGKANGVPQQRGTVTRLAPSGQTEAQLIKSWYEKQPEKWRQANPINTRGRIKTEIREAYEKAAASG